MYLLLPKNEKNMKDDRIKRKGRTDTNKLKPIYQLI